MERGPGSRGWNDDRVPQEETTYDASLGIPSTEAPPVPAFRKRIS